MRKAIGLVLLAMCVAGLPASSHATPLDACDWAMYGHDVAHSFAAAPGCSLVTPLNLETLHPKWFMPTPAPVTAQPAVADGVMYVGSADGTFYAMATDPEPGPVEPLWTFNVGDMNQNSYGSIVSSAALADVGGLRVVVFAGGSTLYVLNAASGAELAEVCVDPRSIGTQRCKGSTRIIEIESSPAIVQDGADTLIFTGMDFNEDPQVGRAGLLSFKLHTNPWTLETLWKFDPETQKSYTADASKTGQDGFVYTADPLTYGGTGKGCGNVWSSPAVDLASSQVYFGVANCGRVLNAGEVGGEGTVAVDMHTGKMAWRHIQRPNDPGNDPDFDTGASPQLLPENRVGEGGKDGTYYAYPRTGNGTPDWATHVVSGSDIGGIIGSSALGASTPPGGEEAPTVFASSAIPFSTRTPDESFQEILQDPTHAFALHAINAVTGELLWQAANPLPSYAAVTYANGLVYLSDTFGFSLQIYDANTGAMLWAHPLNGAPSSAPALVGDSIYLGTGTSADPVSFVGMAAGIWAFQAVTVPEI